MEEKIEHITQKYLYENRGKGLSCETIVTQLQEIMDDNFNFEIIVELDNLSNKCVVIHSEERQFEEVIKYIGKQIKT